MRLQRTRSHENASTICEPSETSVYINGKIENNQKKLHVNNNTHTLNDVSAKRMQTTDGDRYGDVMKSKPDGTFRICFQNIQNMPAMGNTSKSKSMIRHIKEGEYDVVLMAEVGLYWPHVRVQDTWAERTLFDMPKSTSIFAYNREAPEKRGVRQFGGTGIVTTSEATARVKAKGRDLTNMGRWTWVLLQGKEGHNTICVSAYRPVVNVARLGSVYQQQLRWLLEQNDKRDPLTAFDEDLCAQLHQWMEKGTMSC